MCAKVVLLFTLAGVVIARPDYSYEAPSSPSPLYGAPTPTATPSPSSSTPSRASSSTDARFSPLLSNRVPSRRFRPTRPSSSVTSPSRTSRPSRPSSSSESGYSYNEPTESGYSYNEPSQGPAQYDTQYIVSDEESGNNFGQQETRDGDQVSGTYYVQLPDGRLQVVTYTVSEETGYVAEVTYEGQTTTAPPANATPSSN